MKKYATLVLLFTLLFTNIKQSTAQCVDCNTMICDGISSDDGSPADGVQTSRKCGCGSEISGACAYVEIDLTLNPYYDVNDPACGLIMETQESGNFNIYFIENGCDVADCSTPDFTVSSGATIESIPNSPTFSMMVCKNGGNAGRRDFNFSITCSTIENCVNSVDDDNNGFIDCDDPGCNLECDYSSTTSSFDGGLESNNRLSDKIAARNFERAVNSTGKIQFDIDFILPSYRDSKVNGKRENISISSIAPWDGIENTTSIETTPIDLLQITNATDIFAFDTYKAERRIASVLVTETSEKVYEHSKYICDRLGGSTIEAIWNYDFGSEHNFIVTKFINEDGSIEYNCNFSIIKNNLGKWCFESHWQLNQYSSGTQTFNFQLWANNTDHLQKLVQRFMANLKEYVIIEHSRFSEAPIMFVKSIKYHNRDIKVLLHNPNLESSLEISGFERSVERSTSTEFTKQIDLQGRTEEEFLIKTEGIFDMSFAIKSETGRSSDIIYIADGAWGIDNQRASAIVHYSEFKAENSSEATNQDYLVERGIELKGRIKNEISIYRALTPHQKPIDLSDYESLLLTAAGKGSLEITLINKGIVEWDKQARTTIVLQDDSTIYSINKSVFDASQPVDWNHISMIVFKIKGDDLQYQDFQVSISNVRFTKEIDEVEVEAPAHSEDLLIYPNPIVEDASVYFTAEKSIRYEFQVWSLKGDKVSTLIGNAAKGLNQLYIKSNGLNPGVYISRLLTEDGKVKVAKFTIF